MPTLRTVTLGCRVNQYETELVRQGLERAGFVEAAEEQPADLCIVNSCTVTHEGDAKSRQAIRKLAKHNPQSKLVVMGCYATRAPDEIAALPGVSEVLVDKRELPDFLQRQGVVEVPDGIERFPGRQRAYVKVQDGCILSCTFCIIPSVRPGLRSRPVEQIVAEVRRLAANGHREIVLTGIHLGHYGVDLNQGRAKAEWVRLSHLVERLVRLDGDFRIRLSSIEATEVTRELLDVMAAHPRRVCPHLHISMQSGSDGVLRRMRRRWGAQRYLDRCRLAREMLDHPALTTDVIVGFPGETDREFAETLEMCRAVGFSQIHVFPFSRRRGTPAAAMPDQVDPRVLAARVDSLRQLGVELRDCYHRSLVGRRLQMLVEGRRSDDASIASGTVCRFATTDLAAERTDEVPTRGSLIDVTIEGFADGRLSARR